MDIPENVFDLEFEAIARTKTAAENINANIAALCIIECTQGRRAEL